MAKRKKPWNFFKWYSLGWKDSTFCLMQFEENLILVAINYDYNLYNINIPIDFYNNIKAITFKKTLIQMLKLQELIKKGGIRYAK